MAGLKPLLKDIADAIRAKSGTAEAIPALEFANKITSLLAVGSNGVWVRNPLHLSAGDTFNTNLTLRDQDGAVATFDGKTMRVPMIVHVDSSRASGSSVFDIVISFE